MSPNILPSRNAQSFPKAAKTARPYSPKAQSGSKRKLLIISGLVLLLLIGTGYGAFLIYRHSQRQAQLAALDALRAQMQGASDQDRRELWQQMRDQMQGLPEDMRQQMRNQREAERMADFFSKTKEEQIAELNKDIDRMLARRKQREEERAAREAAAAAGAANGTSADQSAADSSQNGNGGGGPGRRGAQSDEQRLQRSEGFKENVPPAQRAQMTVYRQMMRAQMQQRGVSGGGGGFF